MLGGRGSATQRAWPEISECLDFMIPLPSASLLVTASDGAGISVRRYGQPGGRRLVLSHGNGFAMDGYYPFWRHLLSDFDVILYDQRNHGRNERHLQDRHTIAQMARDAVHVKAAIAGEFGSKVTFGVFHSVSAIANIIASSGEAPLWDGMVLVDPPLVPPADHALRTETVGFEHVLANWARQRPSRFATADALAALLRPTPLTRHWVSGSVEMMAEAIVRPARDGGFELSCPPEFEAQIYEEDCTIESWELLLRLRGPVALICADPENVRATPPAKVCQALSVATDLPYVCIPKAGHMLQVEQPEQSVGALRRFVGT